MTGERAHKVIHLKQCYVMLPRLEGLHVHLFRCDLEGYRTKPGNRSGHSFTTPCRCGEVVGAR